MSSKQMKVSELMEKLAKTDPDAEVRFWVYSFDNIVTEHGASPLDFEDEGVVSHDEKMGSVGINVKLDGRRFIQTDWL